jgi:antitoxin MazE
MQTSISKWGNSLALRLPRHAVEGTKLVEGAAVEVEVREGSIVVTPVRKKFKLADLLVNARPEARHDETDWGAPQGDEEW